MARNAQNIVANEIGSNVSELLEALREHSEWGEWISEAEWDAAEYDEDGDRLPVEVAEWWSVSNWLAKKLVEQGEVVCCGYWGRQTTGQALYMDAVIERIAENTQQTVRYMTSALVF